ncbi:hypothetical protein PSEUDO9AG_30266 [Pseudomonas sp. 9Ag]|nr:hypothetical protein PSEUDO9AG_30266 [Pseudomonas sp. 9Ag]
MKMSTGRICDQRLSPPQTIALMHRSERYWIRATFL